MKTRSRTKLTLALLALAATGLTASARTWTSSDGKRTFEGEFVSATDTRVTVDRKQGEITFDIIKLSADDQAYVKKARAIAETKPFRYGAVPEGIGEKLKKLEGGQLKGVPLEVTPEYYFLAFSASW